MHVYTTLPSSVFLVKIPKAWNYLGNFSSSFLILCHLKKGLFFPAVNKECVWQCKGMLVLSRQKNCRMFKVLDRTDKLFFPFFKKISANIQFIVILAVTFSFKCLILGLEILCFFLFPQICSMPVKTVEISIQDIDEHCVVCTVLSYLKPWVTNGFMYLISTNQGVVSADRLPAEQK